MAEPIDFDALNDSQKLQMLRHVFEREGVSIAANDAFLVDMATALAELTDTAAANRLIGKLNHWSAVQNRIGERSNTEIQRIAAGDDSSPSLH